MISSHSLLRTSILYQKYFAQRSTQSSLLETYLKTTKSQQQGKQSFCSSPFASLRKAASSSTFLKKSFSSLNSDNFSLKQSYQNFQRFQGGGSAGAEHMSQEELQAIQEIAPSFKYLNYKDNLIEEFEEKVYELVKDTTDDHFLLLEVLSGVGMLPEKEIKAFKKSTRFSKVDAFVKKQLKANAFTPEQLMLLHLYLLKVGGSKSTFEYAIQRVYSSMRELPLLTVSLALQNLERIEDEENTRKFVKKVENVVITTHEVFYKGPQLRGIIGLVVSLSEPYKEAMSASLHRDFWTKAARILEQQLGAKTLVLEAEVCVNLAKTLAEESVGIEQIWEPIIGDFMENVQRNEVDLEQTMIFMDALVRIGYTSETIIENLIEYLIEKGYDDEDLTQHGLSKSVSFIHNVAQACPKLENAHFLVFAQDFVKKNLKRFKKMSLLKVIESLRLLQNLPDKKLVDLVEDTLTAYKEKKGQEKTGQEEEDSDFDSEYEEDSDDDQSFIKNE